MRVRLTAPASISMNWETSHNLFELGTCRNNDNSLLFKPPVLINGARLSKASMQGCRLVEVQPQLKDSGKIVTPIRKVNLCRTSVRPYNMW
jgi:hypothetical protein